VIIHVPDEKAPPSAAQPCKEPGPRGAGAEQIDNHRVGVPRRAEVFEVILRRLKQTFPGRVQVGDAPLREELLMQSRPEQAAGADKEELARAAVFGVAFQPEAREY